MNQSDYSYMWWLRSIKNENTIFAIKTSRYSFSFDFRDLVITNLFPHSGLSGPDKVLREKNEESFPQNMPCILNFGMDVNGITTWCRKSSRNIDDCQLIETGKYFHRRFIHNLPGLKDCDKNNSGLEISSWPDRLALILRICPEKELNNTGLVMSMTFPDAYHKLVEKGDIKALINPGNNSGFIFLKSSNASEITVSGTTVKAVRERYPSSPAGKEMNAGIIIYPMASGIDAKLDQIARLDNSPVKVTALQATPSETKLHVSYNSDLGWHQVILRNDGIEAGNSESNNQRIERVKLVFDNGSSDDRVVRLCFSKGRMQTGDNTVFGITGISAILRDQEGNPVGIPVQLSKNWHTTTRDGISTHYFRGPWYHGLTMLTIPGKTSLNLEYTGVNALWGGVPAASHAQLCLVGWGSNQQWEESAIGAWGESICYEPDLDQAGAPLLDFRPLMVRSVSGGKWGWTGNMGGADFFNYTKTDGTRSWHSRMRTQYRRYCPNLTEVTYAGTMDDQSMDFEYTASLGRSDDMIRGIYHLRLKVNRNIRFKDFVVFQAAASTYHYTRSATFACGDEHGLKKQWMATIGGPSRYITAKEEAGGKIPWFSFTGSGISRNDFLPANRGFVIRSWKARINGTDHVPPSFAEYNATGGHGETSGLINITPPAGCDSFLEGDYIEAIIELFQIPLKQQDYYGPNQNLISALEQKADTWEMVYREALGNDLDIKMISGGRVLSSYPVLMAADEPEVVFSVTGGNGYVPFTLSGLPAYKNPALFEKINGEWKKINQEVHGNDFWQTEYRAATGKWDITYNINLDSPGDIRQTRELRFNSLPLTGMVPEKQTIPGR